MLPAPALPRTTRKLAATAPAGHGRAAGTAPPAGASITAAASEARGSRLTASKRNPRRAPGGVGEPRPMLDLIDRHDTLVPAEARSASGAGPILAPRARAGDLSRRQPRS